MFSPDDTYGPNSPLGGSTPSRPLGGAPSPPGRDSPQRSRGRPGPSPAWLGGGDMAPSRPGPSPAWLGGGEVAPSPAGRAESLDPPRFAFGLPRRASVLRAGAVAGLLCLAAGVLLMERPAPAPVAGPIRVSPSELVAPAGLVGFPLRLADSGVASVVRPGARVDVLGADGSQPARMLAGDVLVLRAAARGEAPEDGTLIYLAVTPDQAARLAGVTTDAHVTVTVRSP